MKSKFINPLTIFIGLVFFSIAIITWWWGKGLDFDVILKLLFAPFLLDISKGVGEQGAYIFRWFTAATYLSVVACVAWSFANKTKVKKAIVYSIGMILTINHIFWVGLGFVTTGLH